MGRIKKTGIEKPNETAAQKQPNIKPGQYLLYNKKWGKEFVVEAKELDIQLSKLNITLVEKG